MRTLPPSSDIAVVGAGAAGLAAAIFIRRFNQDRSVVLLDGAQRPGAKILVSGGSRCNVTNIVVTERDFWGGRPAIIRRVLRAFPVADTVAFFREIGIALHEEANGKLFPDSNRARDVLDALLRESDRAGVTLAPGDRVLGVNQSNGHFTVVTSAGELRADAVVLATGGKSLPKSGSDGAGYEMAKRLGHTIVPTTPALAPLVLSEPSIHAQLSGVSQDVELTVWADGGILVRLAGALLWTHFGVSGPVAMNASRHWLRAKLEGQEAAISVNFCPGRQFDERRRRAAACRRGESEGYAAHRSRSDAAGLGCRRDAAPAEDRRRARPRALPPCRAAAAVAGAGRVAAAGCRLARLHLRRGDGRRRRARRDRSGDDGVASLSGAVLRRRDPRRRRQDRRVQFPVGVVECLRGGACAGEKNRRGTLIPRLPFACLPCCLPTVDTLCGHNYAVGR